MEKDKKIIETTEEWKVFAKDFLQDIEPSNHQAVVVALSGDLGVGKTTFVQSIGAALGVEDTITSPTFTILKTYKTDHQKFDCMVHMDAYRLESLTELTPLQYEKIINQPRTLFCIEWAEKIKTALPEHTIYYELEINRAKQHTIHRVC